MKYTALKTRSLSQTLLSTAHMKVFSVMVLAFIILAGSASAQPAFTLNTHSVDMCPCATTRIIGTLESTPPGTYTFSSDSNWVTMVPANLPLGAGESGNAYIYITPDCYAEPGAQSIKIKAESSVGSASANVGLNILQCHGATISPSASKKSACIDTPATFGISIKNTGKTAEEFRVSSDYGVVEPETVSLGVGETKEVKLYAAPDGPARKVTVTATSTSSYAKKSTTVELLGENCYSSNLEVGPAQANVCRDIPAKYKVIVQNTGTKSDIYTLSVEGIGKIGVLTLGSGEQKTMSLEIPTENRSIGDATFNVALESASRPDAKVSKEVTLSISNCYSAEISLENESLTVCPGMPAKYAVVVKNTGNLSDKYSLDAEEGTLDAKEVALAAGAKKTVYLTIGTALNESKEQKSFVSLQSKKVTASAPLTLNFESFGKCYDFEISAEPSTLDFTNSTRSISVVSVKNTGKDTLDFVLKLDGPSWAYLDPAEFEIGSGDMRQAYIYAAPPYGIEKSSYAIKVQATNNGKVSKVAQINAVVGNETPVLANATNEIAPSGRVISGGSLKKTITLIVIGVVIIAAIILLPGMLARKKEDEEPVELKDTIKTEVQPDIEVVLEEFKKDGEKKDAEPEEKEEHAKKKKRGRPAKKKNPGNEGEAA